MAFRILHCISSVNPKGGGPIEGLKQLSAVNIDHGHEIEVVSMDYPDAPWVRECPLPCHAMGPSWLGYSYSPRFVPWLRANRHRYDVVIVNGIWQYSAFGVWRALAGTPTPYFVFTHGMLDPWFKRTYPLKHLKKWLYWPWGDYRVLRDATAVLFTCEEERRLARQSFWLYKCDEFVINYGTNGPIGDARAQKQLFLEKFPHLRGKRVLLFLGRVHIKKGPDVMFQAFAEVLKSMPESVTRDLHIVVAGPYDDSFGAKVVAMAKELGLFDRTTWTGMITGDLKWGAFYNADAFVLPSHQENFGIAVAEAMACGVPVLISNQVNIWREIQQDGAGFVDTDDQPGTCRLLVRWLTSDPSAWAAMRVSARASFDQRFHIGQTAKGLIRAMELFGLTKRGSVDLKVK